MRLIMMSDEVFQGALKLLDAGVRAVGLDSVETATAALNCFKAAQVVPAAVEAVPLAGKSNVRKKSAAPKKASRKRS